MTDAAQAEIEQLVRSMATKLDVLVRAVQGEIDAGNVGLVRRVAAVEKRITDELDKAAETHRQMDASINSLKIKMAGYGFLGSGAGAAVVYAIIEANRAAG